MKNKEQKIEHFSCQEGLDSVSNRQNFSWNQQTNSSSKSIIRKHVLSGVLAFFVCFAIFAAVVFPLQQTSQISSPLSTIAATGPNNTDGWWIDDGRRGDSFAGGTGTQDDPYLIETAEQLAYLSYLIYSGTTDSQYSQYISGSYYFTGAYFKQTANIDLSDYYWQPIGNSTRSFSGNYDGSGYTVSGVYTPAGTGNAYSYQGLFGYVYGLTTLPPAIIEGVVLTTSLIQGNNYVAGIVGFGRWVIISNCSSSADVVGLIGSAGIVGSLSSYGNMVINCSNHGTISGTNYVGGVVGRLSVTSFPSDIFIANSYNEGDISGSSYVGGIAGDSQGSIFECYNIANISGESNVGGVAGRFSHASVDVCYNAGSITGSSTNVGGIIGYYTNDNSASSKVSNCFNVGAVLGSATNIGGIIGQAYYYSANYVYSCYFGGDCDNIDGIGYSRGTGDTQYSENLLDLVTTENWFLDESNWAAYLYWDFTLTWTFQNDTNNNLPILIDKNEKNVWTNDLYIDTDWKGTGTANDPFLISSAEELAGLSYNVYYRREAYSRGSALSYSNYYFKQTANIDLSTHIWQPIGYSESSFAGNYDGNGFSTTGLHTSISKNYSGLFGSVEGESSSIAVINNVSVINSSVSGTIYVGGIAGYISSNAKISKGYFDGEINGKRYVGGIVGISTDSLAIDNSYNKGTVFGTNYVGGISGGGSVIQSYNLGSIVGTGYVGGITGSGSPIRYSYNLGSINGHETYIGGIAGYGSTVDNCYYGGNCESTIGAVNGEDTAGASYSATLATDAKDANWYRSSMPWDLNNVWQLDAGQNDGYPTLRRTSTSTAYWTDDGVRGTSFAGGSGTKSDPFQIETAKQLAFLSYMVYSGSAPVTSSYYYYAGVYFVQTADIDLSGYYWQPIGIYYNRAAETQQHYFSGNYDGGGHTVSGITTPIGTGNAYRYQGLFGYIAGSNSSNRAEITNIGVVDSFIQGAGYVGGIVGYISNSYSSVTNSYSSATINSIGSYAGGIVGGASNYTSVANNCYNTGSVFGAGNYVGGITGQGSVTNSYNLGTVRGAEYVGGITGYGSTVRNNFNLGSVSGSGNYLGGIAGQGSTVTNNYYGGACENIGGVNGADTAGSAEFSETLADDARTQNWLTSTMGFDMYFVWKLDPEQNDGYPVFITDPAEANWWLASEDNYDLEWKGDGSRTNPYQISSAEELAGLSYRLYSETGEHSGNYYYPNKYFVLTTNIDLSAHAWEPIGSSTAYFSGIFDGAGYEISGVMGSSSYTYFALFSHVVGYGPRAEIKNLTVTDSVINAGTGAAGLLVLGENISISNCTSDVTLNASSAGGILTYGMASGIALSVYNGVIENCENMSTLNGSGSVAFGAGIASFASNVQITGCTNRASFNGMYNGGITVGPVSISSAFGDSDLALNPSNNGYSLPATITDCTNYGNLSGTGVAGIAMCAGEVLRCVNYGNIEGSGIAGIVATNTNIFTSSFFSTTNIQYCVNYGTLTGSQLGGIASQLALQNGTFANCTNYGEIVATSSGAGGVVYQVEAATNTTLSNLANYGVISGSVQRIGGLIARIRGSSNITITLEDCVNANAISITGQGNSAGGLVGETTNSGWTLSFENCVNTGNITAANSTIGGIIGSVSVPVTMTSVFSLGNIDGSTYHVNIGGLIGASTASTITITSSVFEGDISSQLTSSSLYFGGFIGNATNCTNLSITGSYVNTDITVASANAYASGMIGSITMSDTSSPAAIDKCAVVANISTSAEGEMTNSREFYFSPNLVDSATILNSYALFNNSLTISDTTTGMDGYFAYLDNFQNGLPIPIGLYYITAYGTTTGIVDQLQKFVG